MNMLLHVALHDLRQQISERANIFRRLLEAIGITAGQDHVGAGIGNR